MFPPDNSILTHIKIFVNIRNGCNYMCMGWEKGIYGRRVDYIKFVEIKKAVNQLLKERYPPPQYRIYGKEVKEGYCVPCFFTEILDKGSKAETRNFSQGGFTVKIVYFQQEKNELDQLEKADEIKCLFGLVFSVGNRKLTVGGFSHDFIGEYSDILEVSVELDYLKNTRTVETAPIAEKLEARTAVNK